MIIYNKVRSAIINKLNGDENRYNKLIKAAQLWHNPLNFDSGETIKNKYGWDLMFDEAMKIEGIKGGRYYFKFKGNDMTDIDNVLNLFLDCKNFKKYSEIWVKHAPKGINSKWIYLLAITEMTTKGFNNEKRIIEKLKEEGRNVVEASFEDDYNKGIDVWVDGEPRQIKSKATAAKMQWDRTVIA